ncbi:MAG: tetratricopeptide repeat protein [Solirubrobacterales bacterium]
MPLQKLTFTFTPADGEPRSLTLVLDDAIAAQAAVLARLKAGAFPQSEAATALLSGLPAGGTFVELGAGIGFLALLSARLVGPEGRVIALETDPVALARMARNALGNRLTNLYALPEDGSTVDGLASEGLIDRLDGISLIGASGGTLAAALALIQRFRPGLVLAPDLKAVEAGLADLGYLGQPHGAILVYHPQIDRDSQLKRAFDAHRAGRHDEARAGYEAVLAADPDNVDALHLLGVVHRAGKNPAEAARLISRALALNPALADAWGNLGNALIDGARFDEAIAAYRRALDLKPAEASSWVALGRGLKYARNLEEAIAAFAKAQELDPANVDARLEHGLALLTLGDVRGWDGYEARWETPHLAPHRRAFPMPEWQGEDLAGRRILVHAEQGLGDTLFFARYVPVLAAQGAHVVFTPHEALLGLMGRLAGVGTLHRSGTPLPEVDLHCPLMGVAKRLRTTLDTIPCKAPYLSPDKKLVTTWRKRLRKAAPSGLKVGIIWAGRATFAEDHWRSPGLAAVAPLFDVPGVHFFALQKEDGRRHLADRDLPANVTDLGADIQSFDDTAAIMAGLDLVISSCTAPAHLAGALGRPLWMMLSAVADWRWLRDREDSPWYPSARLFRQERVDDWEPVVRAMARELTAMSGKLV